MKILHVVGTRPQYIKLFPLYRMMAESPDIEQKVYDTGQHFDYAMSGKLLEEFGIKNIDFGDIAGQKVGKQLASMVGDVWQYVEDYQPDYAVIYGDTNSTLAASIVCAKLQVPYGHVEAGVRTDPSVGVQEGINRIVADHLATNHYCVTQRDNDNLLKEGICSTKIELVGDLMYDAFQRMAEDISFSNANNKNVLVTIHRSENVDQDDNRLHLINLLAKLSESYNLTLPLHPRFKHKMTSQERDIIANSNVNLVDPLSYKEMVQALKNSGAMITDSGGAPKDAAYAGIQSLVLRNDPLWHDLYDAGYIKTIDTITNLTVEFVLDFLATATTGNRVPYTQGLAAPVILKSITEQCA